ncbi:E3 ubiquitin-protein ligase WAV3-like, partial [Neltuma alba]|uniref:E3 ubiquitin-protein ligase WAV3-like n=1 Tax=Neltuma alba TaxID=207710 RepID=UPI0010A320DC
MGSKWRKVKLALGMNMCVYVPRALDDSSSPLNSVARASDAHSRSSVSPADHSSGYRPMTPTPSSSGLRLPSNGTKSPKGTCAICLTAMKPGLGHAIFTAECSHSFHFHCITSNVKHGNRICPVCRAEWKEVPFQGPASNVSQGMTRINQPAFPPGGDWTTVFRRLPSPPAAGAGRQSSSIYQVPEPAIFNDDDALDQRTPSTPSNERGDSFDAMEIRTYPEISAVPKSVSRDNFAVLIHLKAPHSGRRQIM